MGRPCVGHLLNAVDSNLLNAESPRKHPENIQKTSKKPPKIFKKRNLKIKAQWPFGPRDGAGHLSSLQVGPDMQGFVHLLSDMAGICHAFLVGKMRLKIWDRPWKIYEIH